MIHNNRLTNIINSCLTSNNTTLIVGILCFTMFKYFLDGSVENVGQQDFPYLNLRVIKSSNFPITFEECQKYVLSIAAKPWLEQVTIKSTSELVPKDLDQSALYECRSRMRFFGLEAKHKRSALCMEGSFLASLTILIMNQAPIEVIEFFFHARLSSAWIFFHASKCYNAIRI